MSTVYYRDMQQTFHVKTTPFKHQKTVLEHSADRTAYALFMDMGTGKTKVIIDNFTHLFMRGEVNGLLVIAPKGVYDNWVNQEIPTHLPDDVMSQTTVVLWQAAQTKKFQSELAMLDSISPSIAHVLVMNVEAINTDAGVKTAVKFLQRHKTMMVIDESTVIKNRDSQWTRRIIKLGRGAKYRRILTGTPITNSPLDVYCQFEFLDPDILGHASWFSFRNRYALLKRMRINQRTFDQVIGYQNLEELQHKMRQAAALVDKKDCLDLPEKVILPPRKVNMSDKQRDVYLQLKKQFYAELEGAGTVTANMALTRLLRLHQVACGFVTLDQSVDDGEVALSEKVIHEIDANGGPRIAELLKILEECQGKVIIWANYTYNVHSITARLQKEYGINSTVEYSGRTPQQERPIVRQRFQDMTSGVRFFVGQPRTGGRGLTLTAASTVIYFSNNYSLETRLQSEDRAHRIGQDKSVSYIDLVTPGTVDQKIIHALRNKQELADQITGSSWRNVFDDLTV